MASNIPLFNKEIDDSPHGFPLECYRSIILTGDNHSNMNSSDFPKIYGDNEDQIIQSQQVSQQPTCVSRKSRVAESSNKAHSVQYYPCSSRQFLEDANEAELTTSKAVNFRVNHKTFKRKVTKKQDKVVSVPCLDDIERKQAYDQVLIGQNNEQQQQSENEEETKDNDRDTQMQVKTQLKNPFRDQFVHKMNTNQDELIINLNASFTKEKNTNDFSSKNKVSSSTDFTVSQGVSYSQNAREIISQICHEGSIIPFAMKNQSQNDGNTLKRIQPFELTDKKRLSVSLTDEATPNNHDKNLSTKNSYSPKETRNKQISLMSPVSTQQDNENASQFIMPTPLIEPLSGNQLTRKENLPFKLPETLRFDEQNPTEQSVVEVAAAPAEIQNQVAQQMNENNPNQLEEEEQINQSISNTRIRLVYRVSAIHSLRSLLIQKLTLKKMWLILHYFPLSLVFLIIAIHQTIAFCNFGIVIHMYLFAFLSFRNFFINIFVYQKLIRHVAVLELYMLKPFCHDSLRNSLKDMQKGYKSLENIEQKRKNTDEMNKKIEQDKKNAENVLLTENQESLRQKSVSINSQNLNNLQQEDIEGNQQKGLLDKDSESLSKKDNNQGNYQDKKILIESDISLQKNQLIQEIFNLPLLVLHMNEEIHKKLLKAPNIINYQGQYQEWRASQLAQSDLSPNELIQTDLLIDIFQLLQRIADQNAISRELESAIKYGTNNFLVKVLKIYQIFEEGYMMLYTIMQTTMTFCSPSIGKVAIVFGFYFSVVRIVQLTAVVLSLSFITLGLVFYFFYKIIRAFRNNSQIKTVPFKKAKLIILKDTKITELDMENAACVICYEAFKDADPIFLSSCCQKCYHKACILEWFKKSKNCPLCRSTIS